MFQVQLQIDWDWLSLGLKELQNWTDWRILNETTDWLTGKLNFSVCNTKK